MTSSVLRKARVIVATLVIILFFLSFVDFRYLLPEEWFSIILYLQFTPSLAKFMNAPALLASGFIVVIALSVLTGRTYCSFICPLGIFQDVVSRAGGRFNRRNRRFAYRKPGTILRYLLLAVTVLTLLGGSMFMLTVLDPYSIAGRFGTYFIQPVVTALNNSIAWIAAKLDYYGIFRVDFIRIPFVAYLIPLAFLALIGTMSFRKGRLYCNTVCPVGTFLGLLSKISLFRINIDKDLCSHCGRCAASCKASCIDFINEDVDVSRCISCFNCIGVCPDSAISYGFRQSGRKVASAKNNVDNDRRHLIAGALALFVSGRHGALAQKAPVPTKESTVKENKTNPVCPYGAISIEHFTSYCTACSLCVSACPEHVIVPSFLEYGITGMMQPRMDYHKSFCNFDCIRCTEVCPTGALLPLTKEAKKLTQIGKVTFIKENCIVHTEKTDCGACSEHCPTKAVQMVPYEGNLVIPEVNNKLCVGCGACEYACPTKPFKAIFVDGNAVHQDAEKPEKKVIDADELEEFPF